jgi:hypothetical protein
MQTAQAELLEEATTRYRDVVIVGGRLFAYACLIAVPAVTLVLMRSGCRAGPVHYWAASSLRGWSR